MKRILPPVLRAGARIAVTCPASPPDPDKLSRGAARLRDLGFDVVLGATCAAPRAALHAGADATRAAELLAFLRDPKIDAVFAGRGGVGCMRLLPYLADLLDPPVPAGARAIQPKWIVGRSDLTALHLSLYKSLGWIGLSGPMVATDLGADAPPPFVVERTIRLLTDAMPIGRVETGEPLETWVPGPVSVEGPLFPVNLSLLASLVGTGHLPSFEGAILVLEEIEEPPHRIDRMLTQLRLSGILEGLAGLVFGQFTGCRSRDESMPEDLLVHLLQDHAGAIGVPAIGGFPYGHERDFHPLPVGSWARIQSDPGRQPEVFLDAGGSKGASE